MASISMSDVLINTDLNLLRAFVAYVKARGYNAAIVEGDVVIKDVTNNNNNFRVTKRDGYYVVYTICISPDDFEYSAKCQVYVLLSEYNQSNGTSTHLHMNFKVNL